MSTVIYPHANESQTATAAPAPHEAARDRGCTSPHPAREAHLAHSAREAPRGSIEARTGVPPAAVPGLAPGDTARARVMIVDDEILNIKAVQKYLKMEGFEHFISTTDPGEAVARVKRDRPDVVLLDVVMPDISGLQILQQIRQDAQTAYIPVIILTASEDPRTKQRALELGATDLLEKPVDPSSLLPRVRNALIVKAYQDHLRQHATHLEREVARRTRELEHTRQEVVHCLARAAECRDNETGQHVVRVGRYAGLVAREMGLDEPLCQLIELAAPLHDVGKIGVPDGVLLKPGKLTPEEFDVMQTHTTIGKGVFTNLTEAEANLYHEHPQVGHDIIGEARFDLLRMAGRIALTHHEKWDGNGYPLGLAGEDIPIEGRITAVADVFDALSSKRPYKPAFPREKCFAIMREGRGTHFDPRVLDAFFSCADAIIQVQIDFADAEVQRPAGLFDDAAEKDDEEQRKAAA